MPDLKTEYRKDFAVRFPLFAEERLRDLQYAPPNTPTTIRDAVEVLFHTGFAARNGGKMVANALFYIAAQKHLRPELDIRHFNRIGLETNPKIRGLAKIAGHWGRLYVDPALFSADPYAGTRKSLQNEAQPYGPAYKGTFASEAVKQAFVTLVDAIDAGEAATVFDGLLYAFYRLALTRPPSTPIVGHVSEDTAMEVITEYLKGENRGERVETLVWSAAYTSDPSMLPKKQHNENDHAGVADSESRAAGYGIETKNHYLTLSGVLSSCDKARAQVWCNRLVFVVAQDRPFSSEDERRDIVSWVATKYPDLEVSYITLDAFLRNICLGVGRATWSEFFRVMGRQLQNALPYDANEWNDLVNDYHVSNQFRMDGNRYRYSPELLIAF